MSTVHLTRASGLAYVPPVSLAVRGFVRPRAIPLLSLTGRDGAVVPGRVTLEPRRGTLEGTLRAATFAGAETLRDELLAALNDAPLQLRLGGAGTRFVTVWPESIEDTLTEWPSWPRFSIPLVAPDPYWYAHTETLTDLPAASQVVTNAGNAIVEPVIRVVGGTGGASAISVSNTTTGQTVTFSGTVASGQVLLINGSRRTVTRAGVGVLTLMNQAFRTGGLRLAPGANTITRAFTGEITTFRLEYRARWL